MKQQQVKVIWNHIVWNGPAWSSWDQSSEYLWRSGGKDLRKMCDVKSEKRRSNWWWNWWSCQCGSEVSMVRRCGWGSRKEWRSWMTFNCQNASVTRTLPLSNSLKTQRSAHFSANNLLVALYVTAIRRATLTARIRNVVSISPSVTIAHAHVGCSKVTWRVILADYCNATFDYCHNVSKVKYSKSNIAVRNRNHHTATKITRHHTVLPATRQRWLSRLYSQPKLVLDLATPDGCKAELTWVHVDLASAD